MTRTAYPLALTLLLTGCATVVPRAGFDDVAEEVTIRSGQRITWALERGDETQVKDAVHDLIAQPLTTETALQVALLNNPMLQARYEELGVAQADLVEAGLLKNPVFSGFVRFPSGSASGTNLELDVAMDFLDVLLIPARKTIAKEQFRQTQLAITHEVLDFSAQTKAAYYRLQSAMQVHAILQQVVSAQEASRDFARSLFEAGNISDLALAREEELFETARIVLADNQLSVLALREELSTLMGLWGKQLDWFIPPRLPDLPPDDIELGTLEQLAVSQRLDLLAAAQEVSVLAKALAVTEDTRLLGSAEVGINTEREIDGLWLTGPTLSLELPVFSQGQPGIARAEAHFRAARKRLIAKAIDVRSEVRTARAELVQARRMYRHYEDTVIPLRTRIVDLSQRQQNYMLIGVFELLEAKRNEMEAYERFVESLRDYWLARTELERAVGGRLALSESEPAASGMSGQPDNNTHELHGGHH